MSILISHLLARAAQRADQTVPPSILDDIVGPDRPVRIPHALLPGLMAGAMVERCIDPSRWIPLPLLALADASSIEVDELRSAALVPAARRAVEHIANQRRFTTNTAARPALDDSPVLRQTRSAGLRCHQRDHPKPDERSLHWLTVPGLPANPLPLMYGASDVV